ncbi:MAG: PDZ domain-containing protein, partial [Spirochaetota bacterium]
SSVTIQLWDLREYECDIVGSDPVSDIAVVKIRLNLPPDLSPADLGDSDAVKAGQIAIAIGSPYGLPNTVTIGVVSSPSRSGVAAAESGDFIQTDAALNPGNSGGALVDCEGKCIGLNTAIFPVSGKSSGLGFSIPSKRIRWAADRILKNGFIARAWTGMSVQNLSSDAAVKMKLPRTKAAVVVDIENGSPAAAAGLFTGDVILTIDGRQVNSVSDIQNVIMEKAPGDKITLSVFRQGKQSDIVIFAGKLPESLDNEPLKKSSVLIGLGVNDADEELALEYGITGKNGVVIVRIDPNMPAERSGLMVGDFVSEMDGKPVKNMESFSAVIEDLRGREKVLFLIHRSGVQKFIIVYLKDQK